MEFTVTSEQILGFFGFVAATWGFLKIVKELRQPNEEKTKMLLEHDKKLADMDKRLQTIEETAKLQLQSSLVSINHAIAGNGIEQLKEMRDDIQEYLINK